MAKKNKVPPGQQTRPGEAVQKKKTLGKGGPEVSGSVKKAARSEPKKKGGTAAPTAAPAAPAAAPAAASSTTPAATTTGDTLAHKELMRYLTSAGFPADMVDLIEAKIASRELPEDAEAEDYIGVAVEHPSFQARYPSVVEQWKKRQAGDMSVRVMLPTEVLDYERQLQNTADDYGLSSWVTSPAQISALIMNNVDVNEAMERINLAGYAAQQAPTAFRQAFMGKFGLSEGNLVGYFLDPTKEEGEIKKNVTLGNVVGAAISNGFGNDWRVGERLWDRGYVPQGATMDTLMSEFARATLTSGLSSGLGSQVSADDRIDAAFGDATAQGRVASAAAQREGRFSASGGATESAQGITGLGAATST